MTKKMPKDENYLKLLEDISKIIEDGRIKTQNVLKNTSPEIRRKILNDTNNVLLKRTKK